jgi:Zn-dependent metalloprotease
MNAQHRHGHHCRGRHPLQCIIPPIVLENIARHGDARQRERALDTLAVDHAIRAARLQNFQQPALASKSADALAQRPGGQPRRTIYDAAGQESPHGTVVRAEGQPPAADATVNEAYDGLGDTYTFYWEAYERNSIDDEGMELDGIVHYGQDYDNAFWDGRRMVFGDGDGQLFQRFTIALDVIGHELTHGVTEDEAHLNYWQQSGALNESISDVFGSLVKQYALRQTADQADWLIGKGLLGPQVHGEALRSLKAPGTAYDDRLLGGKDPQPAHMRDYVHTVRDNGGVHTNSGIPNHAFYLAATALGGHAWEKAGRIWYEALRNPRLRPTAQFLTFARVTFAAARGLYGQGSTEEQAVQEGWARVGIVI